LDRAEADETDEAGDEFEDLLLPLLPRLVAASAAAAAFEPIAPRADIALEAARVVGVPLTSLSASPVGSLLTNSFCSN
jgi:hypothetical protein